VGWSVIDRPNVWYFTDVLIIIGCRIHFWTDVLRCCGGKFSILTYILSPDEGGTEFCATWYCHCMWCAEFNFFLSYPAHRRDKHKVMAENLNLKEKSVWVSYSFCCCEFLQMWVVVSPALQVTSRVKKSELQDIEWEIGWQLKFFCHSWLSGYHVYQLIIGLCDKCGVHIFNKIPVCVYVCALMHSCASSYMCVWKETSD